MDNADSSGLNTLTFLESGLTVSSIAEIELETCFPTDSVEMIVKRQQETGFDAIPVMKGRRQPQLIGVFDRKRKYRYKTVQEEMTPLNGSMIVPADLPVEGLLKEFRESAYKLVLYGDGSYGIVTLSDLIKPPVRVLAFALIAHFEIALTHLLIESEISQERWIGLLTDSRQLTVANGIKKLERNRLDPHPFYLLTIGEKVHVAKELTSLATVESFSSDSIEIAKYRDTIAHHRRLVASIGSLKHTTRIMNLTRYWSSKLPTLSPLVVLD